MFALTDQQIVTDSMRAGLENTRAGAVATFEGVVRGTSEGKQVVSLLYEAYGPLALAEGQLILNEAKSKFAIEDCLCSHRTGLLKVGELAVFVAVSAAHRDAAFDACRYIIDEVKERVPIWKQETLSDGKSVWVNCDHHTDRRSSNAAQAESNAVKSVTQLAFGSSSAAGSDGKNQTFELDILELTSAQIAGYRVVDIREPGEGPNNLLRSLLRSEVIELPASSFEMKYPPIDRNCQYLFVCQQGQRSLRLVAGLRARGFTNVWALTGGLEAVRRKYIA